MTLLGLKRNIFESDTPKKKNIVKENCVDELGFFK